jgi:hypothetical protein
MEKIDGFRITMYYYHNEWFLSSKCTPSPIVKPLIFLGEPNDLSTDLHWTKPKSKKLGEIKHGNVTLQDLFWNIWKENNYVMPTNTQW